MGMSTASSQPKASASSRTIWRAVGRSVTAVPLRSGQEWFAAVVAALRFVPLVFAAFLAVVCVLNLAGVYHFGEVAGVVFAFVVAVDAQPHSSLIEEQFGGHDRCEADVGGRRDGLHGAVRAQCLGF